MSLKENYIKLSKKFGGPYALTKKGIKRGWIVSILQDSDIGTKKTYEIAKVLGVTMEELLTGEKSENGTQFSYLKEFGLLSDEEKKAIKDFLTFLKNAHPETKKGVIANIQAVCKELDCETNIKKQQASAG